MVDQITNYKLPSTPNGGMPDFDAVNIDIQACRSGNNLRKSLLQSHKCQITLESG